MIWRDLPGRGTVTACFTLEVKPQGLPPDSPGITNATDLGDLATVLAVAEYRGETQARREEFRGIHAAACPLLGMLRQRRLEIDEHILGTFTEERRAQRTAGSSHNVDPA